MSLRLYNHNWINIHISNISLRLLPSVNTLNPKQSTTTTESSVPWSDFNFPKVCSKTLLDSSTLALRRFLSAVRSYMLHIPNSAEVKLFNRKRKPHTMSEKRHKINKFANYQNIIVRNSPAFDRHVFVSFQDRWSTFSSPEPLGLICNRPVALDATENTNFFIGWRQLNARSKLKI